MLINFVGQTNAVNHYAVPPTKTATYARMWFSVCLVQRCWLFRSWGRVGTTIGKHKLESFASKPSAVQAFRDLYAEKTGNDWEDRANFTKVPNKFYPLDIDYGVDATEDDTSLQLDADARSKSSLPDAIQKLIRLIFDIESMRKAMLEFEVKSGFEFWRLTAI